MERNQDLVARAARLAAEAHEGQTDKVGAAYIEHPARVAEFVRSLFVDAPDEAVAVAWLHDVVEDTKISLQDLLEAGFPGSVVAAVDSMTKRAGEGMEDYFARVRSNPLAVMVKTADLADNTSPERVSRLDPQTAERLRNKYARARKLLAAA